MAAPRPRLARGPECCPDGSRLLGSRGHRSPSCSGGPFCWWAAVVIDHFSRRVYGFALFTKMPTSADVCAFLDRVTKRTGKKPKHIITDKGRQFFCETFKAWCRTCGIRPRFGAVGKHGSIAVLERFFRSMKTECTRRILVPFGTRRDAIRTGLLRDLVQPTSPAPVSGR